MLALLYSSLSLANICICQYPDKNSKYGSAVGKEVKLYKLGCRIWFKQKKCTTKDVVDVNEDLRRLIESKDSGKSLVKIGFVGHWSSSRESTSYLDHEIFPLLDTGKSFEIENTACFPMKNARRVQDKLRGFPVERGQFVSFIGAQTTSIGVWDNVFRSVVGQADLIAKASTEFEHVQYPLCLDYRDKLCTIAQVNESGLCLSKKSKLERITCKKQARYKVYSWK